MRKLPRFVFVVAFLAVIAAVLGPGFVTVPLTTGLFVLFSAYFVRHTAFAVSALSWADSDLEDSREPVRLLSPPSVTVLVPAHNESLVIDATLASLARLKYPRPFECVIIDDGSADDTADRVERFIAAGHPNFRLLRRPAGAGGGKSAALNEAAATAAGEILVVFDADHQPHDDVLLRLARHFLDPQVALVQGRCLIRNHASSKLATAVAIDYLAGYLVNEFGRQAVFELPAYGGANCAVRATALRLAGGWNAGSVTEDTDLTLRLVLSGRKARYDVSARDTEEAVESFSRFLRQRYRWARGHQQCWRDYARSVLFSSHLSATEKLETLMFLFSFHIPALCGLGVLLGAAHIAGLAPAGPTLLPLTSLMFVGPLIELSAGLIVARARPRAVLSLVWFAPTFAASIYVATKALWDVAWQRGYQWEKTARSGL